VVNKINGYTTFAGENIPKTLKPLLPFLNSVITPRDKRRYSPGYLPKTHTKMPKKKSIKNNSNRNLTPQNTSNTRKNIKNQALNMRKE